MRFRITTLLLLLIIAPFILSGCGAEEADDPMAGITTYEQLNEPQYRIGVISGTISGPIVEEMIPRAQVFTYNGMVDLFTALDADKLDAIVDDNTMFIYHNIETGNRLRIFEKYLRPFDIGYAFPKTTEGRKTCDELSEYIKKITEDGTLKEIEQNWLTEEGDAEMAVDYTRLPAPNGVLHMATTSTSPPFSYIEGNMTIGYDIDIVARFCEENGYGLEIASMAFNGVISAVSTGKCELAGCQIAITDERKESVEFTEPYYHGGTAVAVNDPNAEKAGGFFKKLKDSLYKTFVRDHRYRLFISGILTTILITFLSALFGTVLGFLVFMGCRGGNRVANKVTGICIWIIKGLPVVVLLMILYYLAFAKTPVSGTFVSIIAFTLTFGAAVYGMLRSSVGAIDRGQTEAALALGFSNLQAFFRIVMPQALKIFLPSYKAEIVSLIKATAVVGYIAVQDLTRMGDIVRSRTYEAFFPLISVAIIYFIISGILVFIVKRIEIRFDPRKRSRGAILKGVKTND